MSWGWDDDIDVGQTIAQYRLIGAALCETVPVPVFIETAVLTDRLSLNVWCPPNYLPRLEAVLAPFGDRVQSKTTSQAGGDIDLVTSRAGPSIVIFGGLAAALAEGLIQGSTARDDGDMPRSVPDIVHDWCAHSEALLKAVRAGDKATILIPVEALLESPEAVTRAVAHQYGLGVDESRVAPQAAARCSADGQAAHFELMASCIAQTSEPVRALLDQWVAASIEVPGTQPHQWQSPDFMRRLLTQTDALHRTDQARVLLLERDAQSTQLAQVAAQSGVAATQLQEDLARRDAVYTAQAAEIEALRAASDHQDQVHKANGLRGKRLEHEVDGLARNIQMRDDRIAGLAQALCGYEDEVLALRDEVAALRQSTSWRLTAPVRGVSMMLRKIVRRG